MLLKSFLWNKIILESFDVNHFIIFLQKGIPHGVQVNQCIIHKLIKSYPIFFIKIRYLINKVFAYFDIC